MNRACLLKCVGVDSNHTLCDLVYDSLQYAVSTKGFCGWGKTPPLVPPG